MHGTNVKMKKKSLSYLIFVCFVLQTTPKNRKSFRPYETSIHPCLMVTAERTSNPSLMLLQTNLQCQNTNSHSNLTIYNKRKANLMHINPVITAIVTTVLDGERSDSFSISITQKHSLYWAVVELHKPCGYTSCL